MTMHPLVYGHDALPDLLHECIAYHITPEYCRLPEGVAIQGALHSCNMEFNVPHTALHGCNVFRHAGLPCGIYGIAHIWMIPHSHHAPPVAGKQYTLQDNVPIRRRRILCSSEQSKLCPCRTKSLLSDKNQLARPKPGIFLRSRKIQ